MNSNANLPVIPRNITVHLGNSDSPAANVTIPFVEYVANVASSEIYPTWPIEALKANILAQTSFALNRIYTEFYRSRGYDFDITSTTRQDQSFVNGREIFENINNIVGDQFNSYIRRQGSVEPLFAAYCDGIRVTCNGLSQWGSVELAEQGLSYIDILKNYYGDDIEIVTDVPIVGITGSAPAVPLRIGQVNDDVRLAQLRLNRISSNYPNIPKIAQPDGIFSFDTEEAVKAFQRTFGLSDDGIIGNATWYKIISIYNAVRRLNELDSEGITLEEITKQYPSLLRKGDTGSGVASLQYYLNYISQFYDTVRPVAIDGIFGDETESAVKDFQNTFGLTVDGLVGIETWNTLYSTYLGFISTIPLKYTEGVTVPFPGVILRIGSESDEVRLLQEYLNYIAGFYPSIPAVNPTGYFGQMTQNSVIAFQREFGYPPTGTVNAPVWNGITEVYSALFIGNRLNEGQFPGYSVGS